MGLFCWYFVVLLLEKNTKLQTSTPNPGATKIPTLDDMVPWWQHTYSFSDEVKYTSSKKANFVVINHHERLGILSPVIGGSRARIPKLLRVQRLPNSVADAVFLVCCVWFFFLRLSLVKSIKKNKQNCLKVTWIRKVNCWFTTKISYFVIRYDPHNCEK